MKIFKRAKSIIKTQTGQALVLVLMVAAVVLTVTTVAIGVVISSSYSTLRKQNELLTFAVAESGAEESLIRLLRNPNYSGGNLLVSGGNATITVGGNQPPIVVANLGNLNNHQKKVQLELARNLATTVITINQWKEIE